MIMNHVSFRTTLLAAALLLVVASGCTEDPTSVGAKLLPSTDFPVVHRDTLYAVSHRSTKAFIVTQFADQMMLGSYQTYQAWAALKFHTFPDTMLGATITSATLQLRSSYRTGDSLAPFAFSVYEAVASIMRDSLTMDSLTLRPLAYHKASPVTSVSGIGPGDTLTFSFSIPDTAMLNRWFSTKADTISGNFGLLLMPTSTGMIRGLSTMYAADAAFRPTLTVKYTKGGVSGTYSHQVDSTRYFTTVDEAALLSDPSLITVQNGISYRGFATFDLSRIPNPSLVSLATFDFTQNPGASRLTWLSHDSLYAGIVNTDGTLSSAVYRLSDLVADSLGRIHYQFNATAFVQAWMKNGALPRTVSLSGFDETGTLDLYSIYGSTAPMGARPRLIITYSTTR